MKVKTVTTNSQAMQKLQIQLLDNNSSSNNKNRSSTDLIPDAGYD